MVIGFLGQTVIPYHEIAEVSAKKGFWSLGLSGVSLKLRGIRSNYQFNLRDPKSFVKLIESHLTVESTQTRSTDR